MIKKKISKKQNFSLDDMKPINIQNWRGLSELNTDKYFENKEKIGLILLQCLIEDDTEAFMEILDSYIRVNRKRVAEQSGLARSTVQLAFSKKANPTLKTIAKIVHEAVAQTKL